MILHIIAILVAVLFVIELIRLLNFGNAGGLASTISRPLFGCPMPSMFLGLIIWLIEIAAGVWAILHLIGWIF